MIRAVGLSVMLAAVAGQALGCACCVDRGERDVQDVSRDAYIEGEFGYLRSNGRAELFVSPCDLDCVRGIDDPAYEYEVTLDLSGWAMELRLADETGMLRMEFPYSIERFIVDPDPLTEQPNVALYNEFRIRGFLEASGVFAETDGAAGELVLVGKTNHCWSAVDLNHWVLDVKGEMAEFRLFGGFESGY